MLAQTPATQPIGIGDIVSFCQKLGKSRVLGVTALLLALVAFLDWVVGNSVSLAVLYIFPTMLGAVVLRPVETAGVSMVCAALRAQFDTPASHPEVALRFAFALLAYLCSGLFVTSLVRNRELVLSHLSNLQNEQQLRREAEKQLSVLVESSPAAILTLDGTGAIIAANRAAHSLLAIPPGQALIGRSIAHYLPVLYDAIRLQLHPQEFRTSAQCQGHREDGELFHGHTWFSSYLTETGSHLAAIVVDTSEEMREQEEQNLAYLAKYNRITASAISHEVLNLCSAIHVCCGLLREKHNIVHDEQYDQLLSLLKGLERIASFKMLSRTEDELEVVAVKSLLDTFRIIVESEWREVNATILWPQTESLPSVLAESHGLLQALLNLAQNSLRAIQQCARRELRVSVSLEDSRVFIRLQDSGPGIAAPEHLFQPFQPGSDGTGLGLYISRAILRSYAGDLRFVPQAHGTCFVLELQLA
jgi:two-component system, LuxR family, sensor kinase FixL